MNRWAFPYSPLGKVIDMVILGMSASKAKGVTFVLLALAMTFLLRHDHHVFAGAYLDSAHGNSTEGVDRNRTGEAGYAIGNCAHCHEQHGSIGGESLGPNEYALLYDFVTNPCDLVCYWCHRGVNSEGQAINYNYPYSVHFGGGPEHYGNIREQFCSPYSSPGYCGSNHDLVAIRNFIANKWGFPAEPDPCAGCHNPHLAQRNWEVEIAGGKLKTAISRPSDHDNLWGDDEGERMNKYNYLAPYYLDPTSLRREPDGSIEEPEGGWGSNMPDYVTFCLDCHQDPQVGGTVKRIDWGPTGDRHGASSADKCYQGETFEGTLRPPYDDSVNNYVLSCTDCHEPHGARRRLHLIRRYINGELVAEDTGECDTSLDFDWSAMCQRCHNLAYVSPTKDHSTWGNCVSSACHGHGVRSPVAGSCNDKPML